MLTILNDVHIGALRSAGTTPTSQLALRSHLINEFKRLLPDSGDLLILGDLFDTANIPLHDVLKTYEVLSDWLHDHPASTLYNVAGNHDISKTSSALSSFAFLGKLLSRNFPKRYVHIDEPTATPYGYIIPHLRNQELFDLAIDKAPADTLFLHCNYDNGFAAQSDQSLNLSPEQAAKFPQIVIAHEHHTKAAANVILPGNQIASSVSDWLAPSDKRYATLKDGKVTLNVCARRADQFKEIDWRNPEPTDCLFVRFTGTATADEAGLAISTLNKYRANSEALIVANGITILQEDGTAEAFSNTLQSAQAFDIVAALRKIMTPSEMTTLEQFL